MEDNIDAFRQHVRELAARPEFVHHKWFSKWHLEIIERIAVELCGYHPKVDKDLIKVMAWLHDYAKILDFEQRYNHKLFTRGREKLVELGFEEVFADKALKYVEWADKKLKVDLHEAPIEVQIIASADSCSHMVGPFLEIFWHEATDTTFKGKRSKNL